MAKRYSFSECLAHPHDSLQGHLFFVAQGVDKLFESEQTNLRHTAILAGLLHDVGKATGWFQARIRGETTTKPPESYHAELSAVIAWHVSKGLDISDEAEKDRWRIFIFLAILKHHGDLDYPWAERLKMVKNSNHHILIRQFENIDLSGIETWLIKVCAQLRLPINIIHLSAESVLSSLGSVRLFRLPKINTITATIEFYQIFGSVLQADKIHAAVGRAATFVGRHIPPAVVDNHIAKFPPSDSTINQLRNQLKSVVEKSLTREGGKLFTLTAPTGSGKTLTILNAVLKWRASIHSGNSVHSTIIYCLPFTSIIEQNFQVIQDVLTNSQIKLTSDRLLKHHHLVDILYVADEGEFEVDDSALFVETWQSEIVVTTFHQLLYTIFTNRNRYLKRFSQLRNAIVILDEVQAIPRKYWDPIRRVFQEISDQMGSTFVLMTATKPLIFTDEMSTELVPHPERYFKQLNRFELRNHTDHPVSLVHFADELVKYLSEKESQMIVVNTRRAAVELFFMLKKLFPTRQVYCLSTNLTPRHRKGRIQRISDELKEGVPCVLVTTQLIEAGVDLSFDVVDRDLAPLDSIIQAAGRCNRHDSGKMGRVTLWDFVTEENSLHYAQMVYRDPVLLDVTKEVLRTHKAIEESELQQLGERYFKLMWERSDESSVDEIIAAGRFDKIEEEFVLINKKWFEQSYFVIQDEQDEEIWDWYASLDEIEDRLQRKLSFLERRSQFFERVIQVPLRSDERPDERVLPLYPEEGQYDVEIGYVMDEALGVSSAIF